MMVGFKNEENERKKVYEELANVKEQIKSLRVGSSSAASSAVCQTSTSGTELEYKLDAEGSRNQRMGQGLVDESNDRTQRRTSDEVADGVGRYFAQGSKILCWLGIHKGQPGHMVKEDHDQSANKGEMVMSLRALRKEFADKGSKSTAKENVDHWSYALNASQWESSSHVFSRLLMWPEEVWEGWRPVGVQTRSRRTPRLASRKGQM